MQGFKEERFQGERFIIKTLAIVPFGRMTSADTSLFASLIEEFSHLSILL